MLENPLKLLLPFIAGAHEPHCLLPLTGKFATIFLSNHQHERTHHGLTVRALELHRLCVKLEPRVRHGRGRVDDLGHRVGLLNDDDDGAIG